MKTFSVILCLLFLSFSAEAKQPEIQFRIDKKHSYVIESVGLAYLVMQTNIVWSSVKSAKDRRDIRRELRKNIFHSTCQMLRQSGKTFDYIKRRNGHYVVDLWDATGKARVIKVSVPWSSCRK